MVVQPTHIGRSRSFDVGGACYCPPRGSYSRDWTERRDVAPGEPAAPEVRVPDIAPIFARYDGATVVVLESFEHIARLLGSAQ